MTRRARRWLDAWGPMLPMFIAEGTIWVGFGALLPILPIYFTQHGVDLPTLGIVVAAWPAARLLGEPLFGWIADRGPRKAMMIVGSARRGVRRGAAVHRRTGGVHRVPRARRPRDVDLRPRRPRLPRRRQPARRHGDVRPVRRGADGRPDAGPAIGGIAPGSRASRPSCSGWPGSRSSRRRSWWRSRPNLAHVERGQAAPDERKTSRPAAERLVNRLLIAAVAFNVGSFFASGATRWCGACTSRTWAPASA